MTTGEMHSSEGPLYDGGDLDGGSVSGCRCVWLAPDIVDMTECPPHNDAPDGAPLLDVAS